MAFRGAFKVKTWGRKKTQVSSTINDYLDLNYLTETFEIWMSFVVV